MYLLDTNHCSFILDGEPTVIDAFRNRGNVTVGTSVIVAGELRFMAQNSEQRSANLLRIQTLLQRLEIYPIDEEVAVLYGDFKADLIQYFGPQERSRRRTFD